MDDLTVPVIDRLISLAPARLLDVEGFTYIDKDRTCALFTPPVPSPLGVMTLSGFVALLEAGIESFHQTPCLVHVEAFNQVQLMAVISDKFGRRQTFVTAIASKPERNFMFNQYHPQEEFNIALRSMFVQDDALHQLVALAGNIAANAEVKQEDDGFSQNVSAKAGVYMLATVTAKPRVTLKPFRTFFEVDQPAGEYIFRVKRDEAKGILCALFEADAGRWKLEAMDNIKLWLQQQLGTSGVTALNTLPVVA